MSDRGSRGPGYAPELLSYLRDIAGTALLSRDEERDLAGRVAQGDPSARDRLIRANLRLVVHIATDYRGRGLDLEDLVAEGNLGLMRAVEGFDGQAGVRFSTYASFWVKQSLRRAVMNQGKPVRLPAHMMALLSKRWRASKVLDEGLGRAATPEEVGQLLGLPLSKRDLVAKALVIHRMFSKAEGSCEDGGSLDDLTSAEEGKGAWDRLVESEDRDWLIAALGRLDEREATVLRLRFGLDPYPPMTRVEVGRSLGLTRERIRQIEGRAIGRLVDGWDGPSRDEAGGSVATT